MACIDQESTPAMTKLGFEIGPAVYQENKKKEEGLYWKKNSKTRRIQERKKDDNYMKKKENPQEYVYYTMIPCRTGTG